MNKVRYENDKLNLLLLQIKSNDHKLSLFEKIKLKRLSRQLTINKDKVDEKNHLIWILLDEKFITQNPYTLPDGTILKPTYSITPQGIKALKTNYFKSEISEIKSLIRDRRAKYIERIIIVILTSSGIYLTHINNEKKQVLSDNQSTIEQLKSKIDSLENYIFKANVSQQLNKITQNPTPTFENKFYDFRSISETDCEIQFEIWYYYDGSFGTEMIYIDINLLDADQIPLDSSCGTTGSQILTEKTKVIAKIDLDCSIIGKSKYIELCMEHSIRGGAPFYCETFPLEKTWDCK